MRCARMHKRSLFRLFPDDDRRTPDEAYKLKIILNRRLAKEGDARIEPFRLEFLTSRTPHHCSSWTSLRAPSAMS